MKTIIERTWAEIAQAIRTGEEDVKITPTGVEIWVDGRWESVEVTETEGVIIYLNIYMVDRAYGGPEEGGWYFDYGLVEESIPLLPTEGQDLFDHVKTEHAKWAEVFTNEGRRPIYSVLSEGEYQLKLEIDKGQNWPAERPHYE